MPTTRLVGYNCRQISVFVLCVTSVYGRYIKSFARSLERAVGRSVGRSVCLSLSQLIKETLEDSVVIINIYLFYYRKKKICEVPPPFCFIT